MEIVRKVVTILVLLAIFPAIYFLPVVNYELTSPVANDILSAETEKEVALGDNFTGKDLYDLATGRHEISGLINDGEKPDLKWPALLASEKTHAILCAVFFALSLVAAIFIIVWSIVSRNRIVTMAVGAAGVVTTLLAKMFFGKVCAPILSGQVGLIDLAKQFTGGVEESPSVALDASSLVDTIMSYVMGGVTSGISQLIQVNVLELGSVITAIVACFVAVIVWNISFYLVELGDDSDQLKKSAAKKSPKKKKA